MLRAILISPETDTNDALQAALTQVGSLGIARILKHYPNELELSRVVRATGPHVILLNTVSLEHALQVAAVLENQLPGLQVVAISRSVEPDVLLQLMRLGVREFLAAPFPAQEVLDTILRLREQAEKRPPVIQASDAVYSFLPAKPGVGTTTIALNVSMAMSRLPEAKVLLKDLDLSSGLIRFMLKLHNPYSIADAADHSARMDENMWPQLVSTVGSMDILHAGTLNPSFRLDSAQLRYLLDFARRNYEIICCDLSGNMEKFSVEVMQESKVIFLVTTAELPSLHLAREKLNFLKSVDLADRVNLLLNRCQKRPVVSTAQIEELMGIPVRYSFSNDYMGVHKSLTEGRHVDSASVLGQQFKRFASTLVVSKKQEVPREQKKSFIDYFSVLPSRYSLFPASKKTAT